MKKINTCCLIDDDHIFIYGTKRMMRNIDFCEEIIEFNEGESAIEGFTHMIANNIPLPELIFLDLNMPIMNGWEFLDEWLKLPEKITGKVSIYILSSSVDPRDLEKVKEYSIINNYILKPLSIKILSNIKSAVKAA